MTEPVTVDFETEAIQDGTGKSPKPVGLAMWIPGEEPKYMAWGHPEGNNCQEYEAKQELHKLYERAGNDAPILFHHGKFDMGVAYEHWGFPMLCSDQWRDTMYEIYLHNPLAKSVSLKPSAHSLLGMPPDEQDAVADYVLAKGFTRKRSEAGAYISKVPAQIVGPYGIGDVVRTRLLHDHLYPEIVERQWEGAYRRERKLAPILINMEKKGVRINRVKLEYDYRLYSIYFDQITEFIQQRLGRRFNVDSGAELAKALVESGLASNLKRTPTGRLSTARDALEAAVHDPQLLSALRYRGALKTLLSTFMGPWLEMSQFDGYLHPSWNQVRGDEYGTRTGRLSCSAPNLQNVPTEFDFLDLLGYPPLVFMRRYILPDEGQIIVAADYNGQEMRLLAHFAEGRAAQIYRDNPRADFHEIAKNILHDEAGMDLKRKLVKIVGFSLIYGAGVDNLAGQLGMSDREEVRRIRNLYLRSIPGLKEFIDDVTSRPGVRTWGGRWIPVDRPEGTNWDFSYKLANHLIQGSAADQTKQSIIDYHESGATGRFLMTVHDEDVITSTPEDLKENIQLLKQSMENQPGFDVPFIAEVETGPNWHDLEKYEQ